MKSIYYFYLKFASFRSITIGIVLFLLINGLITGCTTEKQVVIPNVAVSTMPGYTLKDTAISHHDFNVWLVTTATSFDSLFTTEITSSFKPRFDEQIAVAIVAQTATATYKVKFKEMILRGSVLHVFFNVAKEKPDQEGAGWVSVTAFSKNQAVKKVNFYHDRVLIRSIPVVLVY